LARVEHEDRVIVGNYTRKENEACIAGLQNNGHLNRMLELAGGPKVLSQCPFLWRS
jgi:hypothetical protein